MEPRQLVDVLRYAGSTYEDELVFYSPDGKKGLNYGELYDKVKLCASHLRHSHGITEGKKVLLHLDTQYSHVVWFWVVVAAGAIPIVSTPLSADPQARKRHLEHLEQLFDPCVITTNAIKNRDLAIWNNSSRLIIVDEYSNLGDPTNEYFSWQPLGVYRPVDPDEVAFMMLTSGSTGAAKAVEISHSQILSALKGKAKKLRTTRNDTFLNWIGFDHVACVTEIHLHAMFISATQIHLEPQMVIQDPLLWLEYMGTRRVSITFAPNFFLAATMKAIEERPSKTVDIDLSSLRVVVSGGEANKVSTGIAFNNAVKKMGAEDNVVVPAFGMTETCAGSIYNKLFPELETRHKLDFCSVGGPIHGMNFRIANEDNGLECETFQRGALQLKGPGVFRNYHNNLERTNDSFTADGWFRTGDSGYIDQYDNLMLVGRSKDSIIINGVKHFSHELEAVVEETVAEYLVPSYTSVFPLWSDKTNTEEIVVTFLASKKIVTDEDLSTAVQKIENSVFLHCSVKPRTVIPLPLGSLHKSALGKLSRSQIKDAYERGTFDHVERKVKKRLSNCRQSLRRAPKTNTEIALTKLFSEEFGLNAEEVSIGDGLVDMGVDSIRLLRFKSTLQRELSLTEEISIGLLLTNPTIEGLARALSEEQDSTKPYDPVVVLQSGKNDEATPIWFIHPGLGEVLVFLNISRYFSERRVFALRAPGFNPGEKMFKSIDEMTDVYMKAIRQRQPHGPYILIGYSFGSMIAFETTKKLEARGETVFMGSLNGPPHIKWRMVQIDWCELFLNLSYFLGFLTEAEAVEKSAEFHSRAGYGKAEIVEHILALAAAAPDRLAELDLDAEKLTHWADVSSSLQGLAREYDPAGAVRHIDVFHASPLLAVSDDKQVWLDKHLRRWEDHCREPVRFHDSPGAHYTMLDPDHVFEMQKVLRAALKARDVL